MEMLTGEAHRRGRTPGSPRTRGLHRILAIFKIKGEKIASVSGGTLDIFEEVEGPSCKRTFC